MTLDTEWAFTGTCKACGWSGRIETNSHDNPIWVCGQCNRLHNIVTDPDSVKYDRGDAQKKAELKGMYEKHFAEETR